MRPLLVVLALAYPFLAHLAAAGGNPLLVLASAGVLALLVLGPGLLHHRTWAYAGLLAAGALLGLLARTDTALLPLLLPPILINAYLAWLFGHTLFAGRVPLIARLVRLMHPPEKPLDPRIPDYARRLTRVWSLLFAALTLINLVLALLAEPQGFLIAMGIHAPISVPQSTWSLFANLLNYLIVLALFMVEYAVRRRIFPDQPYRDFSDFLRRMIAIGPRLWRELHQES